MKRDAADLTELKITLTQAQCDALADEAKASGIKFFDHCRAKLVANMTTAPTVDANAERTYAPQLDRPYPLPKLGEGSATDGRLDRLEAMMMQMAETIQNLGSAQYIQAEAEPSGTQADFDTIMQNRLAEAEQKGLTAPRSAQTFEAEDDSDYRTIGVRRFNRPAPPNFSSLGSSGRIQREGTPTAGA